MSFRFAFAGDRDISVWVLEFILNQGFQPSALFLSEQQKASHAPQLLELCHFLDTENISWGRQFNQKDTIARLSSLDLDYIICIHFPYLVPQSILTIPRYGTLNLHPAYLPYNRGWHTPSWAMLENTPIGATLHFMDIGVDTGHIVHQKQLDILPEDTANSLYQRVKQAELDVFRETWPKLISGNYQRKPQSKSQGSVHKRQDLFASEVQKIDFNEHLMAGDLLLRLRALTTNQINEAAFYEVDGKRYRIQVLIQQDEE